MSRINRVPAGLQSLLGSQNFGDNPSELQPFVSPTLDQLPFLSRDVVRTSLNARAVTAVQDAISVQVPIGESWELLNVSIHFRNNLAVGARATARCNLFIQSESGGLREIPLFVTDVPTILAAGSAVVEYGKAIQFPRGLIIGPDSQLQAFCTDLDLNAGTSVNMTVIAFYRRYVT